MNDIRNASVVDMVNHPPHYADRRFEVIDVMKDSLTPEQFRGYLEGNILKYIMRYKHKDGLEDLRKASWYLTKLQEQFTSSKEE